MENEKYLKTTNAVYSLLDLFPDEEPLKNRAKEKALAVLDGLISVTFLSGPEKEKAALQASNDIEILLGYLNLANCQGFLTKLNLIIILEEYKKITGELKPLAEEHAKKQPASKPEKESAFAKAASDRRWSKISELLPMTAVMPLPKNGELPQPAQTPSVPRPPKEKNSSRQERIIKVLQERGKAQVADLKQIMPEVTKRTLRRDLDDLLRREKIIRVGEWNQTFYQIRTN